MGPDGAVGVESTEEVNEDYKSKLCSKRHEVLQPIDAEQATQIDSRRSPLSHNDLCACTPACGIGM